jgi:hypothetical protein
MEAERCQHRADGDVIIPEQIGPFGVKGQDFIHDLEKENPNIGTTLVKKLTLFPSLTICLGVLQHVIDSVMVFLGFLQRICYFLGLYDQTLFFLKTVDQIGTDRK